jgi:hypothetical protein
VTILPKTIVKPLKKHLIDVERLHEQAMRAGYGGVELPDALARKYPGAPFELAVRETIDDRTHQDTLGQRAGVLAGMMQPF